MRLGLVQHEQVGIGGQRAGQQDEPPLTARELAHAPRLGHGAQPELAEQVGDQCSVGLLGRRQRRERVVVGALELAQALRLVRRGGELAREALQLQLRLRAVERVGDGRIEREAARGRPARAGRARGSACARPRRCRAAARPRAAAAASSCRCRSARRSPSFVRSWTANVTPARSGALPGAYVTSTSCAIRPERRARARPRSDPSAWRRRCASSPGRPRRPRRPGSRGSGSGRRSPGCRRR